LAVPSTEGITVRLIAVTGLLVGIGILGIAFLVVSPIAAQTQIKTPPDFTFDKGKDSPGPVTFSHDRHKAKVEKCAACHTKVFKMKKGTSGPLLMEKMKAGEQCGACHNGKTQIGGGAVFAVDEGSNCEKCHKP
jgi:c(7)-type cytochrome triheme protein